MFKPISKNEEVKFDFIFLSLLAQNRFIGKLIFKQCFCYSACQNCQISLLAMSPFTPSAYRRGRNHFVRYVCSYLVFYLFE